jgi:hypothetical protein
MPLVHLLAGEEGNTDARAAELHEPDNAVFRTVVVWLNLTFVHVKLVFSPSLTHHGSARLQHKCYHSLQTDGSPAVRTACHRTDGSAKNTSGADAAESAWRLDWSQEPPHVGQIQMTATARGARDWRD